MDNIMAIAAGVIDVGGWFCVIMNNCSNYAQHQGGPTKERKQQARNVLKSLVLGWTWPFIFAVQPFLALRGIIRDAELGELMPGAKEKGERQLSITSRDGRVEKK